MISLYCVSPICHMSLVWLVKIKDYFGLRLNLQLVENPHLGREDPRQNARNFKTFDVDYHTV